MMRSNDDIQKSTEFYEKNYVIHKLIIPDGKKMFVGNKLKRKCRFCGKTEPEVSFKERAHAFPEFTGNKTHFSYEECDSCNHKFSEGIEDNLAKYTKNFHSFGQIRGKKGVPTIKNNVEGGEFRVELGKDALEITIPQNSAVLSLEKNVAEFTVNTEPLIPLSAFKCLVKMGLSLLDKSELELFSDAITWLQQDICAPVNCPKELFRVMRTFTPGPIPYKGVHSCFFKRKDDSCSVPYMTYLTCFGNNTFQIVLPCPKMDAGKGNLTFMSSVTPYELRKNSFGDFVNVFCEDWYSAEKQVFTQKIYMHFDKLVTMQNDV